MDDMVPTHVVTHCASALSVFFGLQLDINRVKKDMQQLLCGDRVLVSACLLPSLLASLARAPARPAFLQLQKELDSLQLLADKLQRAASVVSQQQACGSTSNLQQALLSVQMHPLVQADVLHAVPSLRLVLTMWKLKLPPASLPALQPYNVHRTLQQAGELLKLHPRLEFWRPLEDALDVLLQDGQLQLSYCCQGGPLLVQPLSSFVQVLVGSAGFLPWLKGKKGGLASVLLQCWQQDPAWLESMLTYWLDASSSAGRPVRRALDDAGVCMTAVQRAGLRARVRPAASVQSRAKPSAEGGQAMASEDEAAEKRQERSQRLVVVGLCLRWNKPVVCEASVVRW